MSDTFAERTATARPAQALAQAIVGNIEKVLVGKRPQVELALAAVVAGGTC